MIEKLLKISKSDIAYLQFIIEGYDGLATVTTIDKKKAIVKLFIMPDFADEVEEILNSLTEIQIKEALP